ncbi:MAG: superoxide dismutase family protein [candidate division KSB1 bacterium]|nr:superoxide dismutase family protein [candidate division KSB1 bacterium]MDZ7364463.1 superoxide dismutase family protein [candidate division KSB1 bacterium]MDZ7402835.1 superoxide dismutase family protein [candidate division KSB1 bacterium]
MKWNFGKIGSILPAVALAFTCHVGMTIAQEHPQEHPKEHPRMKIAKAVAVLNPTQGNKAQGVVTFTQEEGGVRVVAKLTGVPKGAHGFHIHEFGDCSAPDATSAGGHFNPTGMVHAGPTAEKRHIGDLGNITADDKGNATLDYVDKHLTMSGAHSIIGYAVILHANPDDFTTQPTGNAGGRIACGVIGVAKQ